MATMELITAVLSLPGRTALYWWRTPTPGTGWPCSLPESFLTFTATLQSNSKIQNPPQTKD